MRHYAYRHKHIHHFTSISEKLEENTRKSHLQYFVEHHQERVIVKMGYSL